MKNQLDREIKEKYMEGILCKSQKWDWYIEQIENTYDIDFGINSFSEFRKSFSEINEVLNSIIQINSLISPKLSIKSRWLIVLNEITLFYLGKIDYSALDLYNDFFKTLALLIHTAKLYNETNNTDKMLLYSDIFEYSNIYQLFKMDLFIINKDFIFSQLEKINYNTDKEINIFQNNVNEKHITCNNYIDKYRTDIINANCFDFRETQNAICTTWQEKFLHEMLQTNYSKGKLSPIISFKNGNMIPDFSAWSSNALDIMKKDFNDEDASFIIESIAYALYKTIPSSKTIIKHAQLLYNYWSSNNGEQSYFVSSFEFLISFFEDKRIQIDSEVYRLYNSAAKTIVDNEVLISINLRYKFQDKSIRKRISGIIDEKKANLINITSEQDFLQAVKDSLIIAESDEKVFNILSDKFDSILDYGSRLLPSLFLDYLFYLIQISQKRNVQPDEVSKEIIRIRYLWKDEYHDNYLKNMSVIPQRIDINKEDIDNYNNSLMENPFGLALTCMVLNEDALTEALISLSKNPLPQLVTRIMVREDFPSLKRIDLQEGRHEIENSLIDYISNLVNNNSYRFINKLKMEQFLSGLYEQIFYRTEMHMTMLHEEGAMYEYVKGQNPEYDLIDYSSSPKLAHLTQLFPIIENKIRYYGELIGIAPICLDLERYNQLKEPTTILTKIITMIYESTQSFKLAADFFMIYFCLYSSYGFNIRNETIHGKSYVKNNTNIAKAFRITLFCLYLIDFRIELCYNEMRQNTVFLDEETPE